MLLGQSPCQVFVSPDVSHQIFVKTPTGTAINVARFKRWTLTMENQTSSLAGNVDTPHKWRYCTVDFQE